LQLRHGLCFTLLWNRRSATPVLTGFICQPCSLASCTATCIAFGGVLQRPLYQNEMYEESSVFCNLIHMCRHALCLLTPLLCGWLTHKEVEILGSVLMSGVRFELFKWLHRLLVEEQCFLRFYLYNKTVTRYRSIFLLYSLVA
jgi:hypothetical protein